MLSDRRLRFGFVSAVRVHPIFISYYCRQRCPIVIVVRHLYISGMSSHPVFICHCRWPCPTSLQLAVCFGRVHCLATQFSHQPVVVQPLMSDGHSGCLSVPCFSTLVSPLRPYLSVRLRSALLVIFPSVSAHFLVCSGIFWSVPVACVVHFSI